MADVYDMGLERPRNCTAAVGALKKMVETHGGIANELRAAVEAYQDGHTADAQQMLCELAEQGVEVAQSNCAWLYYKGHALPRTVNATMRMLAVRRMLERAGQQGGADAHLRLGDMDWYGYGRTPNITAAAQHYFTASARRSQQASFALGYMHQFGKGVPRNLTLARRYYLKSGNRDHFTRYPSHFALALLAAQTVVEDLMILSVQVRSLSLSLALSVSLFVSLCAQCVHACAGALSFSLSGAAAQTIVEDRMLRSVQVCIVSISGCVCRSLSLCVHIERTHARMHFLSVSLVAVQLSLRMSCFSVRGGVWCPSPSLSPSHTHTHTHTLCLSLSLRMAHERVLSRPVSYGGADCCRGFLASVCCGV